MWLKDNGEGGGGWGVQEEEEKKGLLTKRWEGWEEGKKIKIPMRLEKVFCHMSRHMRGLEEKKSLLVMMILFVNYCNSEKTKKKTS